MDVQGFSSQVQAAMSEYESELAELPEEMLSELIQEAQALSKSLCASFVISPIA